MNRHRRQAAQAQGELEARLRRHYDEVTAGLPDHGPGLDAVAVDGRRPVTTARRWRPSAARTTLAAASIVAVAGVAALALQISRGDDQTRTPNTAFGTERPLTPPAGPTAPPTVPPTIAPTLPMTAPPTTAGPNTAAPTTVLSPGVPGPLPTTTAPYIAGGSPAPTTAVLATGGLPAPDVTLGDEPDSDAQVAVTVPIGEPLAYWRALPDLDLAWRATSDLTTELCWRTPVGAGCNDAGSHVRSMLVPTSDDQMIVIAFPGPVFGEPPVAVRLAYSSGTSIEVAPVRSGEPDEPGIYYARVDALVDDPIVSAYVAPFEGSWGTAPTLPPDVCFTASTDATVVTIEVPADGDTVTSAAPETISPIEVDVSLADPDDTVVFVTADCSEPGAWPAGSPATTSGTTTSSTTTTTTSR